ncbi:hypothetical protein [Microbacterium paludicola]|uniref:hypothetical protein n=1 Tax=Microbacterium paludicola TaxID=300019 RepID=UPI0031D099F7
MTKRKPESEKVQRQRYGAPPPKGLEARRKSGNVCTARRTNGEPCANFAIAGSNVCRTHGGAASQVRAKAQVRILMASDLAASRLIQLMQSPKVADNVKLAAARDLLDRANLAGTQTVEVGVTTKTWDDVLESVLVDVEEDGDDGDVIDAEVVEDGDDSWLLDKERERAERRRKGLPPARDDVQTPRQSEDSADRAAKLAAERANLERSPAARAVRAEKAAATRRGREAYLTALDRGASPMEAERIGERVARGEPPVPGARVSKAQMRRG